MMKFINTFTANVIFFSLFFISFNVNAGHPNLVITQQDVLAMRQAIQHQGRFQQAYLALKQQVDKQLLLPIEVPEPKDAGGGYSHEQHKKNYTLMYNAGVLFQLSQQQKYADYVKDMLLEYAALYPTLPLHPKRKKGKDNPGKLFWQSLNEAVWLVYSIQAFDLVVPALSQVEQQKIIKGVFKPITEFLSIGSASTFNKVHNHGTWLNAGVGMVGLTLGDQKLVEQSLKGLDLSGKGGFLAQLDQLFSPQGYYAEGPYYQRYALLPFVTFAKAIANNQPERQIFQYRDGILLKAITTTIDLSYNGLFFPINDAIKSKGINTIELVNAVAIAYGITHSASLLDIAQQQQRIILTGDGLQVAQALDQQLTQPYLFESKALLDGSDGTQGALVVMREPSKAKAALLFKATSQGLGHGHFDKLTWQFYHQGHEIVSDYGAARFLNVEAKSGGRYLKENNTYAKQTVAHNTVVVDERSHFNGHLATANRYAPQLLVFENNAHGTLASASINTAYQDVELTRTLALINLPDKPKVQLAVDVFHVQASQPHQFDLPLYYQGQFINTNFNYQAHKKERKPLGKSNGYQHLWLTASAEPAQQNTKVTWLNHGNFYTLTAVNDTPEQILFTQIGANDPNFNLRNEQGVIRRVSQAKSHHFVSILEPHGQYDPAMEITQGAQSKLSHLRYQQQHQWLMVSFNYDNQHYLVVLNNAPQASTSNRQLTYKKQEFSIQNKLSVFAIK